MTPSIQPRGYNLTQITLHWVIAALVIYQLLFGDDIKPAYRAFRQGAQPASDALFGANLHVYVGIAVLVLACLRLAIRLMRGAPPPPPGESQVQKWIAAAACSIFSSS